MDELWQEGYDAGIKDGEGAECPHTQGCWDYYLWHAGWYDAISGTKG